MLARDGTGWVPETEARRPRGQSKAFLRSIATDAVSAESQARATALGIHREGLWNVAQGQGEFLQF